MNDCNEHSDEIDSILSLEGASLEVQREFLYGKAKCLVEKKAYADAIRYYTQALDAGKNDAITYNDRGYAYLEVHEYGLALQDFEEAIKLDENNPVCIGQKGYALMNLNQLELAKRALLQAAAIQSDNQMNLNFLGILYYKLDLPDSSIYYLTKAVNANPNYKEAYLNLAHSLIELGDLETALDNLDQAIIIDPDFYQAKYVKAMIYLGTGDTLSSCAILSTIQNEMSSELFDLYSASCQTTKSR